MNYKDYYQTLGVAKAATHDEIRKAFRKLAREFHPDVAKDKKAADSKFKDINEAYEVLGDPAKRKEYDELGANWQPGAGPRGPQRRGGGDPFAGGEFGGTGFSDFFEQFFGGAAKRRPQPFGGMGGFPQAAADNAGADIEADLLVTIEEAHHGAKKKISFRRQDSPNVETYEVRIPRGVRTGQRIRLAGQGGSGSGGRAGDLYLRVKFAQHPDYRIEGADLIHELELPVARAVLGGEFEVPTPDGAVRLKIPAGTQPGRKFRIKGRGLASGPDTRGDLFVELHIELPATLTDEARALWEQLAKLEG